MPEATNTTSHLDEPARQRRVVIGAGSDDGRSRVLSDERHAPHVALPNVNVTELWKLSHLPALLTATDDGCGGEFELTPPPGGCTIRFVDLPPDTQWKGRNDQSASSLTDEEGFHQTDTIDLVVVTRGEVCCRLDDGEVNLAAGDVLIQVGTNHAWSVRGHEPCHMISVLFDGHR